MKNFLHIAAALILGISATGCREENSVLTSNGRMKLTTSVMSEIKTASRALSEDENKALAASALIWVSDNEDNCLFKFKGLDKFPSEGLPLSPGRYLAEAWVGDSVPASWNSKRYYGVERFDIAAGADKQVDLLCTVRNTLVSVTPSSQLKEVLNDMSITVSLNDGITDGSHSLVFSEAKGTLAQTGYFMVNSRTKGFTFTIEGKDVNGNAVKITREYTDEALVDDPHGLARATHYKFAIRYSDMTSEIQIGGVYFELDVEADPVEGNQEPIVITLAPTIVDLDGNDLNETIMGEPKAMDRLAIYISAATRLEEVSVTSSLLEKIFGEGNNDVDWPYSTDEYMSKLTENGIYIIEYNKLPDVDGVTNICINFSAPYMNTLEAGTYEITIEAIDADKRKTVQVIHLQLDNAPGVINNMVPSTDLSYTSSALKATVRQAGKDMYFEVKEDAGSRAYENWTRVNATYDSAKRLLTGTATGLKDGQDYVYRLVIDDYTSPEATFKTVAYPQLENCGFEDWYNGGVTPSNNNNGMFPIADPAKIFWDCGNHGSLTMGDNITNRSTDSHSGNYSIEMKSQFVGIGSIGKFAAGNVFYGKYLKTDGTDGELGFGRPWPNLRPRQLKGWVKYHAEAISNSKEYNALPAGAELGNGDNDQGEIYIALLSDDTSVQGDPSYPDYPVVVKTKSKKFFDPQGSNVIAYGKKNFDELTSWTEFTIDIQDVHPGQKVAYIMVVCTASRYGDYFAGGRGSTMWLDDLKLVY